MDEISSAFFFVFYSSQTLLKNANEKDSAFRCLEYHAAQTSPDHFDHWIHLQNAGVFMCVGLSGRRSIGPGLIFLILFASRQKEYKSYSKKFYVLSFACVPKVIGTGARKNERKAHRQWFTAIVVPIAIGIDLTLVLLLTELNNSYHLHRR